MIASMGKHFCHLLTIRALGQHSLVQSLTELERLFGINQLLQQRFPNGGRRCQEVVVPQIDIWANSTTSFISLIIQKPFEFRIREDSILFFIDAESAMAFAPTSKESYTILLIVFVLFTLKAFLYLQFHKSIIEVVIRHLPSHINTL